MSRVRGSPGAAPTREGARPPRSVLLFDGVCSLCSALVRFVLERDRAGRFAYAPLQSAAGRSLAAEHGIANDLRTVVLIEDGRVYTRSAAVLRVLRGLGPPWSGGYLAIVVPPLLRDALYDAVARRRYRWFGRQDRCMTPPPGKRDRFLDLGDDES